MKRRKRKKKTAAQLQKSANRRHRVFHLISSAVFLVILLSAALFALTVFFQVDVITVEGTTRYSKTDIMDGMDVKKGDNLYLWNKFNTQESLLRQFPYLQTVRIRRKLPNELVVSVTEGKAAAAIPSNGGYFLVSREGKVLEQRTDDGGLPLVTGASLLGCLPGEMIDQTDDVYSEALLTILLTLDAAGMLDDTDFINLQSLTDIRIGYLERFDIRVGTVDELAYRLRFALLVIAERLSPSDIGRLDWDRKGRLHFVPESAEEIAKSGFGMLDTMDLPEDSSDDPPDDSSEETEDGDTEDGEPSPDETEPSSGDTDDGDYDEDYNPDDDAEYDADDDADYDDTSDGEDLESYDPDEAEEDWTDDSE